MKVGVLVSGPTVASVIEAIVTADEYRLDTVWMTSGGAAPDPLTISAAAAGRAKHVRFGTAIVQTFPRHPLALVQQAVVIDQLAPGRLRLGVGPSGPMVIGPVFGLPFERPQEHLREYVTILRSALREGTVDFKGKRLSARARLSGPAQVEVIVSALRASAFRLAGEVADGAVSWLCPAEYLRDVALPALAEGAEAAGRGRPPLIAHLPVVLSADAEAARAAFRRALGFFARIPQYQAMWADAGLEPSADGTFSDAMVDAIVVHGDGEAVTRRLEAIAASGIDEVMVSVIAPEGDGGAHDSTLRVLAAFANRR
jgi:F420-dependent oxidoreductase-like protein